MKFFIKIQFFLVLLLSITSLKSQNYYYDYFTSENGLAQSQIFSMLQDTSGRLWLGTLGGGINIYDGKSFKTLTTEDGLSNDLIYKIYQDEKGLIWIATYDGLNTYDGKKFKTYTTSDGLPNNFIFDITQDKNGIIWVGTYSGAAKLVDGKFVKITDNLILKESKIFTICFDSKNRGWFGTERKGLVKLENNKYTVYNTKNNLGNNNVRTIIEDKLGNVWIGNDQCMNIYHNNKLYIYNKKTRQTYTSSTKDREGNIWFSTYYGWIMSYQMPQTFDSLSGKLAYTKIKSFKEFMFRKIFIDKENNIWLGSNTGLIKLPNYPFINFNTTDNIINENVTTIRNINDTSLYIGTDQGVSIYKKSFTDKPIIHNLDKSKTSSFIQAIMEDSGKVWIGSASRLTLYYPKRNEYYSYYNKEPKTRYPFINYIIDSNIVSSSVKCFYKDNEGKIWFGTNLGVGIIDNHKFINFNKQFPNIIAKSVLYITQDKHKNFWFCTETDGVYKYTNNKKLIHYNEKQGLTSLSVASLVEDQQGQLWFATRDGLFTLENEKFVKFDKKRGIASNYIYLLIIDNNNNLYIGTSKGIDYLNLTNYHRSHKFSTTHIGSKEGFIGQECNRNACDKGADNMLWFGTVKGITGFNPLKIQKNTVPPNVLITDVQIDFTSFNWQNYTKSNVLTLPYNKNHLTFKYIATSLVNPEKVKYRYKLVGLNNNWSPPVNKIEQDYPVLPPGEYVFMVKASNNDGVWNDKPAKYVFIIEKPWWQTWWSYTSLGVFILLIIFGYTKYREANLKKEKIKLEKTVKERTLEVVKQKELVEQKNKDITDSINYAKNIQEALLPTSSDFNAFPESFVFFKPRDIVSGDFYWIRQKKNILYVSAADCTGHGVPGAFMSMLGIAFLDEISNKYDNLPANEILSKLRQNVILSLHQTGKEGESKDGMDLALCKIDLENKYFEFSGANNPLYLIRNNELIEFKGDKMPIGFHFRTGEFTNYKKDFLPEDRLYIFSDGFADQFGGSKGKKFKYKPFKNLLLKINQYPMEQQRTIIQNTLKDWTKGYSQLDDILIIGIKL